MDKNVWTKVGELLLVMLRFFWPLANARVREVVGTVVTVLAVVGGIATQVLPLVTAPPAVVVGDVVTVPAEAARDAAVATVDAFVEVGE
jgi:hypothetical protein